MLGSPDNGVPVLATAEARRRRLAVPLVVAVLCALAAVLVTVTGRPQQQLVGAGSTLAQPLVEQAAKDFRNGISADNPERRKQTGTDWVVDGSGIDYEAVGSLGGLMRLDDPTVDFAITDYPVSAAELDRRDRVQFPIAVGAVSVVHNLDLGGASLVLDGPTLAAIYSGTITAWNDPRIAALNRGVNLPVGPIVPIHRADGSGSTFGFTGYLAANAPEWEGGAASNIPWADGVGQGVERSAGVVDKVRSVPGALGYVDDGQARRAGLRTVELKNAAGSFVAPTNDAMTAALSGADWSGADAWSRPVAAGSDPNAYPMTVAIYAVVREQSGSCTNQVLGFLSYIVDEYDARASDLGYLPLPAAGAEAVKATWRSALGWQR